MNISQIWNMCLGFEYNEEQLIDDLDNFLQPYKESKILDCACGSGFAILDLIDKGYDITCSDGSEDMIVEFIKKATKKNIKTKKPLHLKWSKLSEAWQEEFDFVFCRGGSIPYACSWDDYQENGIENIKTSLQNFYKIIKPGGKLYIDITNDQPEETIYEEIEIDSKSVKASEIVLINRKTRRRTWRPKVIIDGVEHNSERYSYYMTDQELNDLLLETGFSYVEKIDIPGEYYTVFFATK